MTSQSLQQVPYGKRKLKLQKKAISLKKTELKIFFLISSDRIFKIYQRTFAESLRYLSQKT